MKIDPQALGLATLQRTSMTEEEIIKSYEEDYNDIMGCVKDLDFPIKKVLDIGCGIAGWECFVEEKNYDPGTKFYLLDKTKVDADLYYGFREKASFYNHMEIAKNNLVFNGVPEENIFLQEATENNEIKFDEEFDLITSFISCGFHYPVETYLDQIYDKLKKGGIFICDIRKGSNGQDKVFKKFGNYIAIKEKTKYWRIKATK